MSTQKLRAIYKQLGDKVDISKERALFEIKELKADLNELQRHLSGRKKSTDIQPDDILRSAYEIAQFLRDVQKREEILDEMQGVAAETEAEEYLLSRGAKLLTRPAGWYFQTAKERFLLHEKDVIQAAAELRKLLAAGKRLKRPKKKKAEPKTPPVEKPAAKAVEAAAATAGKSAKKAAKAPAATKAKKDKPVKATKAEKPVKTEKPAKTAKASKTVKQEKPAKTAKKTKTEASGKDGTAVKKTKAKKSDATAKPANKAPAAKPATAKKKKTPAKK